jgi:hypothetical protein
VHQVDVGVDPRVVGERLPRVRHLQRIVEQRHLAVVRRVQFLERRDDLEARPARIERVVVRDLGPLEHERDAAVGEVDACRQLREPLVGTVAEPEEAPDSRLGVVDVEVHGFVEVRRRLERVHVLVFEVQPDAHRRSTLRPTTRGQAVV